MKNIYPEYPLFPQDFISSYTCASMSMEDFGIFNWMLMHSWVFSEKPCHLPNDPKRIAWLLRIDYQLIINCLSKYKKWVVTDDNQYIFNPRLLSIYKGLCDKSSVYSANRKGKKNIKLKKITIDNQLIINSKSIEQQADNDNDNDNGLVSTREDIPKQEDASSSKGDCKGEAPDQEPEKLTRKRFVPPTLEEVCFYCKDRKNNVSPEKWMAYYESNGWKIGKNPMKSWQAAVRTWEKNEFDHSKPTKTCQERKSEREYPEVFSIPMLKL